nr:MraY family glycosyltransferase [Nitrospira sp.]
PLRHKAAVFMGDAGSMMLGALLAWFAIQLSNSGSTIPQPPPPFAILWMLGLPVLDTVVLMVRRIRQGRSPFSAGRDHMHHIWMHAGFTPGETTLLLMGLNGLLGLIGFAGWHLGVSEWLLAAGYGSLFILHSTVATHAWKVSKWLKRQIYT